MAIIFSVLKYSYTCSVKTSAWDIYGLLPCPGRPQMKCGSHSGQIPRKPAMSPHSGPGSFLAQLTIRLCVDHVGQRMALNYS